MKAVFIKRPDFERPNAYLKIVEGQAEQTTGLIRPPSYNRRVCGRLMLARY